MDIATDFQQKTADQLQKEMPAGTFVEGQLEREEQKLYADMAKVLQESPGYSSESLGSIRLPSNTCVAIPLLTIGSGVVFFQATLYGILDAITVMTAEAPFVFDVVSYVRSEARRNANTVRSVVNYPLLPYSPTKQAYVKVVATKAVLYDLPDNLINPRAVTALLQELKTRTTPFMQQGLQKFIRENSTSPDLEVRHEQSSNPTDGVTERANSDGSPDGDRKKLYVP